MRARALVRVVSAALALGACAALVSPSPRQMAGRRDSVHSFARVRFPERSAGFVRTAVTRFDREGKDVAAHYEVRGYSFTRILATLYVYPSTSPEADLGQEFDLRRRELEAVNPANFVAQRQVRLGRSGLEGRYAAYVLRRRSILGETREQSVLVIARWGNWWIKWRVTAPDTGEGGLPPAALHLIEKLTPAGDALTPTDDVDEARELRLAILKSPRLANSALSTAFEDVVTRVASTPLPNVAACGSPPSLPSQLVLATDLLQGDARTGLV